MISADIKTDVKQEIKKLVAVSCITFHRSTFSNLKFNTKQACIFHLMLVGIPCSLILSIKNEEDKRGEGVFT